MIQSIPRLKTKRWDDPIEPDDGTRILITRYRPRGLPKEQETWSEWNKEVAPSEELLAAYHGKGRVKATWAEYRQRYLREMQAHKDAVALLADRVRKGETLTLLCSSACTQESRCHRSLLRMLIERQLEGMGLSDTPGKPGG